MIKRTFKPGYKALRYNDSLDAREKIMDACFWAKPDQAFHGLNTFYRKMRGETKITELEIREIENVFSEYGINPWTGDKTKSNHTKTSKNEHY